MPKWTDAQQDAIDARGGNILVSGRCWQRQDGCAD
mgnify:CR=1 FL=1